MRAFKILLWKAYFDKGWSLTNYLKYLFAFVGIYQLVSAKAAVFWGIAYLIICFLLGWAWFKFGLIKTENEIQNIFNPFQVEIRKKFKRKI